MREGDVFQQTPFRKSRYHLHLSGRPLLTNGKRPKSTTLNCFLSSVAMNDKDGHGLKFDKVRPTFSCYNCKNYQLRLVLPDVICLNLLHNSTRVFFVRIKALCNDFSTELA